MENIIIENNAIGNNARENIVEIIDTNTKLFQENIVLKEKHCAQAKEIRELKRAIEEAELKIETLSEDMKNVKIVRQKLLHAVLNL